MQAFFPAFSGNIDFLPLPSMLAFKGALMFTLLRVLCGIVCLLILGVAIPAFMAAMHFPFILFAIYGTAAALLILLALCGVHILRR